MPIDKSIYPPNWDTEIVPRIRKRAGNKCEICGLDNGSTVFSLKFYIKSSKDSRYKYKMIWFRDIRDAYKVKEHSFGQMKEVRVICTTAHLDHDETNHDVKDDRLCFMCQYCHLNYDSK